MPTDKELEAEYLVERLAGRLKRGLRVTKGLRKGMSSTSIFTGKFEIYSNTYLPFGTDEETPQEYKARKEQE